MASALIQFAACLSVRRPLQSYKKMKTITIILLASANIAVASIPDNAAVKAIIGEAGGEPYAAQVAVASALRHRGTLNGVYGVNNPCVKRAPSYAILRARKAWAASASHDYAHGCRYFGCPADRSYFIRNGFQPSFSIGKITFYK